MFGVVCLFVYFTCVLLTAGLCSIFCCVFGLHGWVLFLFVHLSILWLFCFVVTIKCMYSGAFCRENHVNINTQVQVNQLGTHVLIWTYMIACIHMIGYIRWQYWYDWWAWSRRILAELNATWILFDDSLVHGMLQMFGDVVEWLKYKLRTAMD